MNEPSFLEQLLSRAEDDVFQEILRDLCSIVKYGDADSAVGIVRQGNLDDYFLHYGKEILVGLMNLTAINKKGAFQALDVFGTHIYKLNPCAFIPAYIEITKELYVSELFRTKPVNMLNSIIMFNAPGSLAFGNSMKNISTDIFLLCIPVENFEACMIPIEAYRRLYKITKEAYLLKYLSDNEKAEALEDGLGL